MKAIKFSFLLLVIYLLSTTAVQAHRYYPPSTVYRFISVFRTMFDRSYRIGHNRGWQSDCLVVKRILEKELASQPRDVRVGFETYFYQVCMIGVYDKLHGTDTYPKLLRQEQQIEKRFKTYYIQH